MLKVLYMRDQVKCENGERDGKKGVEQSYLCIWTPETGGHCAQYTCRACKQPHTSSGSWMKRYVLHVKPEP